MSQPRIAPAVVGMTLNVAWVAVLFGICAFDDGALRSGRISGCVFWCSIMAVPAVLAGIGIYRKNPAALKSATVVCLPLLVISLAGAGLFMVFPAIAYGISGWFPSGA